jgi:hypothetical protein
MKVEDLFESAGNLSAADLNSILSAAKQGDRVVADGKTIWVGLGNRSGLHDYQHEMTADKWNKSGKSFEKKLQTNSYQKIQLQSFKNTTRDVGKWVTYKTIGVQQATAPDEAIKWPESAKRHIRKLNQLGSAWKPLIDEVKKHLPAGELNVYMDASMRDIHAMKLKLKTVATIEAPESYYHGEQEDEISIVEGRDIVVSDRIIKRSRSSSFEGGFNVFFTNDELDNLFHS